METKVNADLKDARKTYQMEKDLATTQVFTEMANFVEAMKKRAVKVAETLKKPVVKKSAKKPIESTKAAKAKKTTKK